MVVCNWTVILPNKPINTLRILPINHNHKSYPHCEQCPNYWFIWTSIQYAEIITILFSLFSSVPFPVKCQNTKFKRSKSPNLYWCIMGYSRSAGIGWFCFVRSTRPYWCPITLRLHVQRRKTNVIPFILMLLLKFYLCLVSVYN